MTIGGRHSGRSVVKYTRIMPVIAKRDVVRERLGSICALGVKLVELGARYLNGRHDVLYLTRYQEHPADRLTSTIGDRMPVSLCEVGKTLNSSLHDHDLEQLFPEERVRPVMTPKSLKTGQKDQGRNCSDSRSALQPLRIMNPR